MSVTISKRVNVPITPHTEDLIIITLVYNVREARLSLNLSNISVDDSVTLMNRAELLLSGYLGNDAIVNGKGPIQLNTSKILEVTS